MPHRPRERTQHELLQEATVKLLNYTGWRHLHVRRALGKGNKWVTTTNIKGWPDLAPCWSPKQPGRIIAIELKVPPDRLSPEQEEVADDLARAGFEFYVITPADLERLAGILQKPRGADYPPASTPERGR